MEILSRGVCLAQTTQSCKIREIRFASRGADLGGTGGHLAKVKRLRVGECELGQRSKADGLLQDDYCARVKELGRVPAVSLQQRLCSLALCQRIAARLHTF